MVLGVIMDPVLKFFNITDRKDAPGFKHITMYTVPRHAHLTFCFKTNELDEIKASVVFCCPGDQFIKKIGRLRSMARFVNNDPKYTFNFVRNKEVDLEEDLAKNLIAQCKDSLPKWFRKALGY